MTDRTLTYPEIVPSLQAPTIERMFDPEPDTKIAIGTTSAVLLLGTSSAAACTEARRQLFSHLLLYYWMFLAA